MMGVRKLIKFNNLINYLWGQYFQQYAEITVRRVFEKMSPLNLRWEKYTGYTKFVDDMLRLCA